MFVAEQVFGDIGLQVDGFANARLRLVKLAIDFTQQIAPLDAQFSQRRLQLHHPGAVGAHVDVGVGFGFGDAAQHLLDFVAGGAKFGVSPILQRRFQRLQALNARRQQARLRVVFELANELGEAVGDMRTGEFGEDVLGGEQAVAPFDEFVQLAQGDMALG